MTQKITQLMGQIDGYSAAPTTKQMQDLAEAQAELKGGVGEIDTLWDEMPKLNKTDDRRGHAVFQSGNEQRPGGGVRPRRRKLAACRETG